jgi:hypothetical protein
LLGERVERQRTDPGDDEQCSGQTCRHHCQGPVTLFLQLFLLQLNSRFISVGHRHLQIG